jgi:hypothetical protein
VNTDYKNFKKYFKEQIELIQEKFNKNDKLLKDNYYRKKSYIEEKMKLIKDDLFIILIEIETKKIILQNLENVFNN